ncbi:hypothetical protein GBA52_013963 [Prunus armeniaca]|nr:hypothetical protein GBA52_013963 [Prunus armeniaca]
MMGFNCFTHFILVTDSQEAMMMLESEMDWRSNVGKGLGFRAVTDVWREDLLQAWFLAEEVNCIRNIPLSFRHPPDTLIWHFEGGGQYTVRSGHEVARWVLLQQDGDDTNANGGPIVVFEHVWKKI